MKKTSVALPVEIKPAKKLFGISSDRLKAVHGGGGVISHIDQPAPPPPSNR